VASVNDIQDGIEEFDLLGAWHRRHKEHTRINFQPLKVERPRNSMALMTRIQSSRGYDPQEILIGRLPQSFVVNVGAS
jgi:hypothetical protein